jgi:hypothetical protein
LINDSNAQQFIAVHFLYGSRPAKAFKNSETKWFGGKKGGHVTIETGDSIIGFQPGGKCHLFGKKKNANGYFSIESKQNWLRDTASLQYTSVIIPVNEDSYLKVKNVLNNYLQSSPYDYAVFGMRCAAATYDILEETGIVKKRTRPGKWTSYFYPQLLRRRILKLAASNNYVVVRTKGRASRKWEKE